MLPISEQRFLAWEGPGAQTSRGWVGPPDGTSSHTLGGPARAPGDLGGHLERRQAGRPGPEAPALSTLPSHACPLGLHAACAPRPYQAPPTSSSAGFASSVRTATAPGPRAAAGGGGGARRTPLCTRPSLPSSGPQAGPPRLPPASLGSGPLSQPASPCPTLTAGPGVASAWGFPCLSPPQGGGLRALAALAAGNPRPAHTSSGAQGNWGGSRDQGDQRRQQGAQRTSPRGLCPPSRSPWLPGELAPL